MRKVEPNIYSFLAPDEFAYYDTFDGIYERIACNRSCNRLIWGYRISAYAYQELCADALNGVRDDWVMDA